MHFRLKILVLLCAATFGNAYRIPKVTLEILERGFRVSIPDEPGVERVVFNINQNRPFQSFEPGEFTQDIERPRTDRWTYLNEKRKIERDDIVYIWTNVQHNQLIYRSQAEAISVNSIMGYNNIDQRNTDSPVVEITTQPTAVIDDNSGCQSSITTWQNRNLCRDQLIFEETFDGGLNESRWQYEVRLPLDSGDAEFVMYHDDAQNVKVENGLLHIVPNLWNDDKPGTDLRRGNLDLFSRCTAKQHPLVECKRQPGGSIFNILPPIVSARINTKDKFSFRYGRVEIRAKIPHGDWLFPLLLLEPLTNNYGFSSYASGQLRVAFARGNEQLTTKEGLPLDGTTLYGGAVLAPGANLRDKYMVKMHGSTHFGNDFHVYKLIWTDRKITFYVDNKEYGAVDGGFANSSSPDLYNKYIWKNGEYMAPFDQEFYITLGVAAGGHADFPDHSPTKPWDNTSPKAAYKFWRDRNNWKTTWTSPALQIDYVRVYAV